MFPRTYDFVEDILTLGQRSGTPPYLFGTDVAHAFHQVPTNSREWRYVSAAVGSQIFLFKVIVFGTASAPTTWGRFGAFLGRALSVVCDPGALRVEVYVDDPVFVGVGPRARVGREIALALLWGASLGYPFAWAKSDGG